MPEPAPQPKAEEPVPTRTVERDAGDLKEAIARAQRPAEASADGNWTLQLSAYQDKGEADRFAADLRGKIEEAVPIERGLPAYLDWVTAETK